MEESKEKIKIKTKTVVKIIILSVFILTSIISIIFITGRNNWKSKFGISNLAVEDDYIVGKIKNKTDEAYDITLKINLKNGSLIEEKNCYMFIKPNETKNIKCISMGFNDYKVKVNDIIFKKKKIPSITGGGITKEALEYYFEDIYEQHTNNFISFASLNRKFDEAYPYIDKVEYDIVDKNAVKITGVMGDVDCIVSYGSEYNASNNKLENIYFLITTKDDELREKIIDKISLLSSFSVGNYVEFKRALSREESSLEYCYKVGTDWCVSSKINEEENRYFYFINRQ